MNDPTNLGTHWTHTIDEFGDMHEKDVPVDITHKQRRRHTLIIGASDRGKSRLFQHLIRQDLLDAKEPGVMVLDPHGTLYSDLIAFCIDNNLDRFRNIHVIDPYNDEWSVGFNPLSVSASTETDAVAARVRDVFCKVWGEDMSDKPGVRDALDVVFYTLAVNNLSLLEASQITELHQQDMRETMMEAIKEPFWRQRMEHFISLASTRSTEQMFEMQMSAAGRRVADFTKSKRMQRMVSDTENPIDLLECMQNGDIVLVNLKPSTKKFLPENSRILGTLLLNAVYNEAFDRTEDEGMDKPFYVYVDECHRFLSSDVTDMLVEMRKFGVHLILGTQGLWQLRKAGDDVYEGVLQAAQTHIVFGGLKSDTEVLARDMYRQEIDIEKGVEKTKSMKTTGYETVLLHGEVDNWSEGANTTELQSPEGTITIGMGANELGGGASITSEALKPILKEGYNQVHSVESQVFRFSQELEGLDTQEAVVKTPVDPPIKIRVADVNDSLFKGDKHEQLAFERRALEASPYARLNRDIDEDIKRRLTLDHLASDEEDDDMVAESY